MALSLLVLAGCIEFSPFEIDLDDDERDQNERNLARLMATPPTRDDLRFAVMSDSHQGLDELCALADVINSRDDVSFVLHVGDMTDLGLRQEYRWTLDCLKKLDVPFLAAIGNHESLSNGAEIFRAMFGAYDYSFVYNHVRVVVINGNTLEFGRHVPDLAWLAEVSAPSPSVSAVVVAAHQLPPTSERDDVLSANNVSGLITGHGHRFKKRMAGETPWVVVGTVKELHWALVTVTSATMTAVDCVSECCACDER